MQWWHESKRPTYDGITFQSSKTSDGINKFGSQSETFIPKVSASFNTEIGFLLFSPLFRWSVETMRNPGQERIEALKCCPGYPAILHDLNNDQIFYFPTGSMTTSRTRCQTTLAPQFLLDHLWWHKRGGTQGPLQNAGIGHFKGSEWIQSPLSLLETCGMSSPWCHC